MTRSEAIRKAIDIIVYLEAHFAKSQNAKKDAEEIIEALEQINEEEPVNKLTQQAYEDGKKDGYLQAKVEMINNAPTVKDIPTNIPISIFEKLILPESNIGHCKDCKHFCELPHHTETLGRCINHSEFYPKGDWFCADFEPQEKEV